MLQLKVCDIESVNMNDDHRWANLPSITCNFQTYTHRDTYDFICADNLINKDTSHAVHYRIATKFL